MSLQEKILHEILEKLKTSAHGHLVDEKDRHLTSLSALELRAELLSRKRANPSSAPLINAVCQFHDRQLQDSNSHFALTDVLTKDALCKAEVLEESSDAEAADRLPLYGFILSIKDSINIKGYPSTCGLALGLAKHEEDTPFIDYLERQGAVIISKANVPQMLFAMESCNNLFGAVSNPWNKARSAGGSSGGDAALIALGHVNAGFGSDIAGSLRIPALFCGVCSMNMTARRVDRSVHAYILGNHPGLSKLPESQYEIVGTIGPMARNVDDLARLTEVMAGYYKVSGRIAPVPWRGSLPAVRRVGVVAEWDNILELTETNRRAMQAAREALARAGVETVDIDMRPYIAEVVQSVLSIFYKNEFMNSLMLGSVKLGEPIMPIYQGFKQVFGLPLFVINILRRFVPDHRLRLIFNAYWESTRYNGYFFAGRLAALRDRLLDQMKKAGVETLLCPGLMPAIIKNTSADVFMWCMYCFVWNGFGFAAGALPIIRVREDEQVYNSRYHGKFEEVMRRNMHGSIGLPVGIQVVSFGWREEEILQVMKTVEGGVGFK